MTDNLATGLQATTLTASEGKTMADVTVKQLTVLRSEESYSAIFEQAVEGQKNLGIIGFEL